ncbi:putative flagellum biosynthesis repressor protein FlbT [Roseibium aquae]|uniref:Flagellum biosynthesis repressor protein FlbT n=1 Tax=Roseibium aquae TaxID=1323746 RepID=A0A916TLP4_9HYPH|nr:flagellar biosynthesis repressor FlbT [Roseibium aquae]GGB53845.1 putative flagellum biosynthesis repressor protein FlbT [Roseibium aquae]
MKIGLKAGERLFINGAVIRAERKTSIELLNDAVFLLEGHVLQAEQATTPLRQIYFILQTMIMDPNAAASAGDMLDMVLTSSSRTFSHPLVLERLDEVSRLAGEKRWFEAMKLIRDLYPIEAELISGSYSERLPELRSAAG